MKIKVDTKIVLQFVGSLLISRLEKQGPEARINFHPRGDINNTCAFSSNTMGSSASFFWLRVSSLSSVDTEEISSLSSLGLMVGGFFTSTPNSAKSAKSAKKSSSSVGSVFWVVEETVEVDVVD